MKTKLTFWSFILTVMWLCGCGDMYELQRIHEGEIVYSGKIADTTVRAYAGFERVVLAWDNPVDAISKQIYIEYKGEDQYTMLYETLVDSVNIPNLTDGTAYDFKLYTLDAAGNRSVPAKISVVPVTQTVVDGLTRPSCLLISNSDGNFLQWVNLSSIEMRFAGQIECSIFDNSTSEEVYRDQFHVKIYKKENGREVLQEVSEYTTPAISCLTPGHIYSVRFKTLVWPIQGKDSNANPIITLDGVWIEGETTITL